MLNHCPCLRPLGLAIEIVFKVAGFGIQADKFLIVSGSQHVSLCFGNDIASCSQFGGQVPAIGAAFGVRYWNVWRKVIKSAAHQYVDAVIQGTVETASARSQLCRNCVLRIAVANVREIAAG